jgi:hypothetical protein
MFYTPNIKITPEESAAHGLMPVELVIDLQGLPFIAWQFPRPNVYLQLSGPPGGPLGVSVEQVVLTSTHAMQLFIQDRLHAQPILYLGARDSDQPLEVEYVAGESLARAHHLAAFYVPPFPASQTLFIDCWIGVTDSNPAPFRERLKASHLEALPNLVQISWPTAST